MLDRAAEEHHFAPFEQSSTVLICLTEHRHLMLSTQELRTISSGRAGRDGVTASSHACCGREYAARETRTRGVFRKLCNSRFLLRSKGRWPAGRGISIVR